MSDSSAYLAYGADLGFGEDMKINEVEDGMITLPWIRRDEQGWPIDSLDDAIMRRLYELATGEQVTDHAWVYDLDSKVKEHYGVEIVTHGYTGYDQPAWILAAWHQSVEAGDVIRVDDALEQGNPETWAALINRALNDLGITLRDPRIGFLAAAAVS